MENQLYPLKPVVTRNALLAEQYNSNPLSSFLISGCMTPEQATELLDGGAKFQTMYLVDGDGEDIRFPVKAMPSVKRVYLPSADLDEAIKAIHSKIQGEPLYGMG